MRGIKRGIPPPPGLHRTLPYWDFATEVISPRWHVLIIPTPNPGGGAPRSSVVRDAFLRGPLGEGASKAVHVVVAVALWRTVKGEWPSLRIFGEGQRYPGMLEWGIVLGLTLAVNAVLHAWSRLTSSRGDHDGVNRMVAATSSSEDRRGRGDGTLGCGDRSLCAALAFANAFCEEASFRHFWRAEFAAHLSHRRANVAQAALFGALHYHGIPSGLAGVGLTFVYGWIMGALAEGVVGGGGLFLPIATHACADYFIFTNIARGKAMRDPK